MTKKKPPAKSRYRLVHEKGPDHFLPKDLPEMTLEQARERLDKEQNYANATSIGEGLSLEEITPIALTAQQIKDRQDREEYRARIAEIDRKRQEDRQRRREEGSRRDAEYRRLRKEGYSEDDAMKISKAGRQWEDGAGSS